MLLPANRQILLRGTESKPLITVGSSSAKEQEQFSRVYLFTAAQNDSLKLSSQWNLGQKITSCPLFNNLFKQRLLHKEVRLLCHDPKCAAVLSFLTLIKGPCKHFLFCLLNLRSRFPYPTTLLPQIRPPQAPLLKHPLQPLWLNQQLISNWQPRIKICISCTMLSVPNTVFCMQGFLPPGPRFIRLATNASGALHECPDELSNANTPISPGNAFSKIGIAFCSAGSCFQNPTTHHHSCHT